MTSKELHTLLSYLPDLPVIVLVDGTRKSVQGAQVEHGANAAFLRVVLRAGP